MSTDQSLAELTPETTINQITTVDKQAGELLASIGLQVSEHKDETLRTVCQQLKWSKVNINHGTIQKIRRAFTVLERDQEGL